jgi:hypothetical protein
MVKNKYMIGVATEAKCIAKNAPRIGNDATQIRTGESDVVRLSNKFSISD